jgi:thioredoxin-related protein
MVRKIKLANVIVVCSCFFVIGFIWGKYGVSSFGDIFEKRDNIIQYLNLDTLHIVDFETNKFYDMDFFNACDINVLVFWSTTCSFCEQFFEDFPSLKSNAQMICFPMDIDTVLLSEYFRFHEFVRPQLFIYNNSGEIVNPFNIIATPTIIVTNKKGDIIYSQIGAKLSESFINLIQ